MSQDFPIEIQSSPESPHKTSFVVVESEEGTPELLHENIIRKRKREFIDTDADENVAENVLSNRNSFLSESSCFSSCFQSEIPEPEEAIDESTLGKGDFDYEDPPIYGFEQIRDATASLSPFSEPVINLASEDDAFPTEHHSFSKHAFVGDLEYREGSFSDGKFVATKGDGVFTLDSFNQSHDLETEKENRNTSINWMSEEIQKREPPRSVSYGFNNMPQNEGPIQNITPIQDQDQERHDQRNDTNEHKYKDMSIQELCRMVECYGFKPSKSKRALVNTLKACDAACENLKKQELTKGGSNEKENTSDPSVATTFDDIVTESHRAISKAVRDSKDKTIWLKMLHYEPLGLEEFTLWLRNSGLDLSSAIILSWCDTYGVLVQGSWHSNCR